MKVSVIIPVYNVEKYLVRCMESVISQSADDFEVVLINDGSTDGSATLCNNYCKKYKSVKAIHQHNKGLSAARNAGIEVAKGDYIMFLDSDDWIEKGTITFFSRIIEQYEPDIITAKAYVVDDFGKKTSKISYFIPQGLYMIDDYLGFLKERMVYTPCAPFSIYKREFLINNNLKFKEGILHEDTLWTPIVLMFAKNVYCADFYFYNHYIRIGSITHSRNDNKAGNDLLTICDELRSAFEKRAEQNNLEMLRDVMVRTYLQGIVLLGKIITDERKFTKKELIANSYFAKTKGKAMLYGVSSYAYIIVAKFWRFFLKK